MVWYLPLFIFGLILVCSEIFLPGGVLGLMGIISIAGSIYFAFLKFGPVGGTGFLLIALVCTILVIYLSLRFLPRSRMGKGIFLSSTENGFQTSSDLESLKGKVGTARTTLRPAGIAVIEEKKVNVVTEGTFLAKGEKVKVIDVEGSKVVVQKVNETRA